MQSIVDQICQPFKWIGVVQGDEFGIYVESVVGGSGDGAGQTYLLASGKLQGMEPWRVRSIAMYVYWYLLTQGVQLPAIAITIESIEAMRSETLEVQPEVKPAIASKRIVGPEAFAVDPAEIKSYVGAQRIQHAPPATSPIGYTEDGEIEIRPGASPRRVMNGRLNW
jgi:hypothetical protein